MRPWGAISRASDVFISSLCAFIFRPLLTPTLFYATIKVWAKPHPRGVHGVSLKRQNAISYLAAPFVRGAPLCVFYGKNMSFTYNDEGIRTSKTVDGVIQLQHSTQPQSPPPCRIIPIDTGIITLIKTLTFTTLMQGIMIRLRVGLLVRTISS